MTGVTGGGPRRAKLSAPQTETLGAHRRTDPGLVRMVDPTLIEDASADGRELRSRRTRVAIVESWLDLVEGGNTSPTAREIADRAGIGLRTVFQHFGDMEALYSSAAALHLERIAPFLELYPTGSFADRVEMFCAHRKRLFERITPVRRAAMHRAMSAPDVGSMLHIADQGFASLVWSCFEPELASISDPSSAATIKLASATALSWTAWEYLRTSAKLSSSGAADVFAVSCDRLLGKT